MLTDNQPALVDDLKVPPIRPVQRKLAYLYHGSSVDKLAVAHGWPLVDDCLQCFLRHNLSLVSGFGCQSRR